MSVALGNSSTSTLANSLSLGPLTQAALDTVSSSSGAAGYSVVSALESYLNKLDQHSQNIRQSLNAIRSNASNKLLAKIFTPLAQMEAELSNISIATKSVQNSGSALSFLHLLTTDRSQGLANLTKSSGSIAAAFLNAPATVATRILSSGVNSLNQISATTASAASQFSGHPVIVTGLGAFNRQLGREAGALDTLNNLTQSWSGYDSQVISAVQNLVEGDVASWAEALGQSSPSNGALSSLQLFNTHLSG